MPKCMLCSALCMGAIGMAIGCFTEHSLRTFQICQRNWSCTHTLLLAFWKHKILRFIFSFGRSCSMVINYNYWDRIWSFVLLPSGLLLVCSLHSTLFSPPLSFHCASIRRPFCNTIKFIDWEYMQTMYRKPWYKCLVVGFINKSYIQC